MQIKTEKQRSIAADRELLHSRFPNCFSKLNSNAKLPLKVGLVHDLLAVGVVDDNGDPLSHRRLKTAVNDYCTGPKYHLGILRNNHRVDLDGNPAQPVTERDRQYAELEISKYHPRWTEKAKNCRAGDGGTVFKEAA